VAESGSLTVTRPARVVGAKEEFGVVTTKREDLSEAKTVNSGSPEGEVGVAGAQTTPGIYSGYDRQWYVISGAQRGARVSPLETLNSWSV